MTVTPEALRRVPLLGEIEDRELRRLATRMRSKTFRAGDVVVEEGTGGIGFSFVLDGTADVSAGGVRRGQLKTGDYFGELALLDPESGRQATITATTELTCASISAWEFKPLLSEHPEMAWQLLRDLARRSARGAAGNGSG